MIPHVLVVGTSTTYATLLRYHLEQRVTTDIQHVRTGDVGLRSVHDATQLVIIHLHLPGSDGLDVLKRFRDQSPDLPLVMLIPNGEQSVVSEALRRGASDVVMRGRQDMQQIGEWLRREADAPLDGSSHSSEASLIGQSAPMQRVFRMMDTVVDSSLTVALLGESGTGKERVATAIHERSERADGPFVDVNCAAIPRDLAESVFFGHEKGAFTGAETQQIGHFESADGGTLFLDEIAELDLGLQAKLLRALENRRIQRVGSSQSIPFDARILCATNANMTERLEAGTFREDLYYRLFQFPIHIPPLRERGNDILALARHFLRQESIATPDAPLSFSPKAQRCLLQHKWPGNVRQLKTHIQRALLIADGPSITPDDLFPNEDGTNDLDPSLEDDPPEASATKEQADQSMFDFPGASSSVSTASPAPDAPTAVASSSHPSSHSSSHSSSDMATPFENVRRIDDIIPMEDLKILAVHHALRVCNGNVQKAAEALDISRSTVYRLRDQDRKTSSERG